MLLDEIKEIVYDGLDDIYVDIEELSSAVYTAPKFSWNSSNPKPGGWQWDEDEELHVKACHLADKIARYGLYVWLDIPKEDDTEENRQAVIDWLYNL